MPQLDIITADLLLLFVMPACGLGIVALILKFLGFIRGVYGHMVIILKDFYYKHYDFFLNLRCFFIMYGSYLAMLSVILYFYTLTFPAIVAFIRVPVFFITKVVLVVKIAKRILAYLERRRLVKQLKRLELEFLMGGGFSGALTVVNKDARIVLKLPKEYPSRKTLSDLKEVYGRTVSTEAGLPINSQEIVSMKGGIEASNTHYKIGFKQFGNDNIYALSLTSDGARLSKKFYGYDPYLKRVFTGNTRYEELSNRIMAGAPGRGQSVLINPIQLHSSYNVVHINDLPSELRSKINPEFFDERLMGLLKMLYDHHYCNKVHELNSALSEEELLRILSKINTQGFCNIQDYRSPALNAADFYTVLTDYFL